ncbi:MAG: SlyX family protein [Rhizobium sp.]|jgi:SlyX protein|uniref:SlyX family protein n=1 Tax=Thiobacillus sp. TaxID=924 RepID=UPI0025F726BE|nr:SlyX family protein [Thiobacillus sp.]MBW8364556.1 SlyX family protein [Rhizobium sp.]
MMEVPDNPTTWAQAPDSLTAWAQARLTEIETKLAFAEDLLDTLNQTVVRQQDQIDSLQQQLRLLNDRLKDARPDESRTLRDDIPPHY